MKSTINIGSTAYVSVCIRILSNRWGERIRIDSFGLLEVDVGWYLEEGRRLRANRRKRWGGLEGGQE